mmetsp:Transcript_12420/g.20866  ORF Transcript_12420/g.20866 Transcript_12420/m.20866 type:complete len:143 (-) Transcript_12420:693-1121(-)
MQSNDWKLLNVFIELTDESLLTQECFQGLTVIEVYLRINKISLETIIDEDKLEEKDETRDKMTQVKQSVISTLFPVCVNKSLKIMTPQLSAQLFEVLESAFSIQKHLRSYNKVKITHLSKIQNMYLQLVEGGAVHFSSDHVS